MTVEFQVETFFFVYRGMCLMSQIIKKGFVGRLSTCLFCTAEYQDEEAENRIPSCHDVLAYYEHPLMN